MSEKSSTERDRLVAFAREHAGVLPLDRSYESLDRLQGLVVAIREGRVRAEPGLADWIASYLGECMRARSGGHWRGRGIVGLRGLPKTWAVEPCYFVERGFRFANATWELRNVAERYDLSLQRQRFEAWMAAHASELEAFTRGDPELDFGVGSMDRVERLLLASAPASEELQSRAARYVGEVVARQAKRPWRLYEDAPNPMDFARRVVGVADPALLIRRCLEARSPGHLRRAVESSSRPYAAERGVAGGKATFLVLFESQRAVSLRSVEAELRADRRLRVRRRGQALEVAPLEQRESVVTVRLDTGPHVLDESRESARELGPRKRIAGRLSRCDARFEVSWDPENVGDVENLLGELQQRLEAMTDGLSWDDDGIRPRLARPAERKRGNR